MQRVALLTRSKFHDALILDVLDQALQNLASKIGSRHFAAAEEDGGFDLVSFPQESQHVILFCFIIVVVHIDAELYFLDHDLFLVLLGFTLALLLLVQEFPIVHDAAYRGLRGGRNLNQIQVLLAGHLERFEWRQDANLIAFIIDHANFACTNALVGADKAFIDTVLRTLPAESGVKIIAWGLLANDWRLVLKQAILLASR